MVILYGCTVKARHTVRRSSQFSKKKKKNRAKPSLSTKHFRIGAL